MEGGDMKELIRQRLNFHLINGIRYYNEEGNWLEWPTLLQRLQNIQAKAAEIAARDGDTFKLEAAETCAMLLHSQNIEFCLGWRGWELEGELIRMDTPDWYGDVGDVHWALAACARTFLITLIRRAQGEEID